MSEPLRPVEVDDKGGRGFKGFFHKWAESYQPEGCAKVFGPVAIIEKEDGLVVLVDLGYASIQFTDVGLSSAKIPFPPPTKSPSNGEAIS